MAKKIKEVENYKSIDKDILEVIRVHFSSDGPKNSKLDIRTVVPDKCFRLNWWSKLDSGGQDISKSLFVTISKGDKEYKIVAE